MKKLRFLQNSKFGEKDYVQSTVTQQTMANRFASESDPLNLLSCSNFQPKISSVYVMKVYPSSDT